MSRADESALFRREYERALDEWLQRRFGYLCIGFAAIELLGVALSSVAFGFSTAAEQGDLRRVALLSSVLGLLGLVGVAWSYRRRTQLETRSDVLRACERLILFLGGLALLGTLLLHLIYGRGDPGALPELFLWHFTACLFLPWRPLESLRPMIPLMIGWAIMTMVFWPAAERLWAVLLIVFSPAILLPGMAIAAVRLRSHGKRFRAEMVGRQFMRMRSELMQARTLHESMFPPRHDDGHIRFDYTYAPMRDVGGDFLHLAVSPNGTMNVTLLDVTGHGLAAALTVNRLFGELERLRAENPSIQPVQVLSALNRYIHLTLSRHNIYATGVSVDIDPYVGEMRYANAGHPPVFVRPVNGSLRELDSTGIMLGAVADDDYECDQSTVPLVPGDIVVAFTDGVVEAANRRGEQFGLARVREALHKRPAPGNWPQFLASLVDRHQAGQSQDDVLVAAIGFLNMRVPTGVSSVAEVVA